LRSYPNGGTFLHSTLHSTAAARAGSVADLQRQRLAVLPLNEPNMPEQPGTRHLLSAKLHRRDFLALAALSPAFVNFAEPARAAENRESTPPARLLFASQGKTGIVNDDGSGLRYFDFQVPGQASWQPGPGFADGKRLVFLSMEPRRD